ncbi:hypothetical protein LP417_25335 [Polaromonas sp. P1-6]|nr:hypothetical protein LP417_25335 [Polaromonas sp. P1-6]
MSHTIFVTAAKLAQAGAQLLQDAGCRVIYMKDPSDAAEVEAVLASEPVDTVISRTVELTRVRLSVAPA